MISILKTFIKKNVDNMQDSKRDADVKNRVLDSVGEGEGGMI